MVGETICDGHQETLALEETNFVDVLTCLFLDQSEKRPHLDSFQLSPEYWQFLVARVNAITPSLSIQWNHLEIVHHR
jgi:hypothetical protein